MTAVFYISVALFSSVKPFYHFTSIYLLFCCISQILHIFFFQLIPVCDLSLKHYRQVDSNVSSQQWILLKLTHSVLWLFYRSATGAFSLIPSFTLGYLYKTPVSGPFVYLLNRYQLTGYKLSPIKWSNTGNVKKIDVLMYLNERRHMAALGVQSMFLPTPYGGASIEWVKA